ncbi:MAG TPA: cation-translocating P-type ATPase [Clostridiaceae bacterium]|nr:cation-translocating P-type ATPase [Clostridiaceae bacterium]
MKHYFMSKEDVLREIDSTTGGLTSAEAQNRLNKYGFNRLEEGKKTTIFERILAQISDPMVLILIAAAVISGITAVMSGESLSDVFIILFVVVLNTTLGVIQERKAEAAIEALKEMAASTSKVMRDGCIVHIKSGELVVGDIVLLEAGDAVPADGRIISHASLKVEEAALTGESVPVEKTDDILDVKEGDIPLGDRVNMVYMGSSVVYGRATVVVTATGMNTEMGKIAHAITTAQEGETPLQKKLAQLSRILTVLVLGICAIMFGVSLLRHFISSPISRVGIADTILDSFMLAVSLAVAAIPEGLVAVVTIVLSIGVTKMSKRNAIIRKLTAVETLGCTQVICTDKTGTLTQNKMTVVEYSGSDERLLATSLALCSDAELNEEGQAEGDPTQAAVVNYANRIGLPKNELSKKYPRVAEIPFDSGRKLMTTLHKKPEGGFIQHTTGAPDVVISKCTSYIENGKIIPLTEEKRQFFTNENKRLASKALRVLAAGYREWDTQPAALSTEDENNLVFLGLVGMIDPVRDEVPAAIEQCRTAGIRPIMITGDHIDTATAIAIQLGIITDLSQAITGAMLDEISDEDFVNNVERYGVYARVKPEHKSRIVNAWRSRGYVTAMTGDGVNDAPSIKNADIGIGMGITGTDVTKNVADMILADDNFATIVAAVEEGRRIYDNIRKSIQFLLSSNLSEVISIFFATILGFTILKPAHILFINLITDSLPALALGMEKGEEDIMKRKPRDPKEGIFSGGVGFNVFYQGVMVAILTLTAYFIGEWIENGAWRIVNSDDGMTMAFLTMSMAEIFHSYNMRSHYRSIFGIKNLNLYLFGSMLLSFILTAAVIYIPFLRDAFGFTSINFTEYITALALAASVIPIVELVKLIQRKTKKVNKV